MSWTVFDTSKHSSVIAHFNRYHVHTGDFARDTYKIIDAAYRIREKCDYSDFFIAAESDARYQMEQAENFMKEVQAYLENKNIQK